MQPCDRCRTLHLDDCCPSIYLPAEVIENGPAAAQPTLGGLLDSFLSTLGARLTPSPLPVAIGLFGAPGWFVPVVLGVAAAAGVGGLYATGQLRTKGKRTRRKARR